MPDTKASIVIPACNGNLEWLMDSIHSAIVQEYSNYDILILSCSDDIELANNIRILVSQGKKITLRHLSHNSNLLTSLTDVKGEVVFFLMPGDRFHQNKIQEHMAFRTEHTEVILSYNAKFLVDSKNEIWFQTSIPPTRNYNDFINNQPLRLSDIVIKKIDLLRMNECIASNISDDRDSILSPRYLSKASSIVGINKPLNYQRQSINHFSGRRDGDEFTGMLETFDVFFYDPEYPREIRGIRTHVLSSIYLSWAYQAFIQNKTADGQRLIREAIRADRTILIDQGRILLEQLILACLTCEDDIESYINLVFSQLPSELLWLTQYRKNVITNVYLLRGIAGVLYGRLNQAEIEFYKSGAHDVQLESQLMQKILTQVTDYGETFGSYVAQQAVQIIGQHFKKIGIQNEASWLVGTFFINQAFRYYQAGCYNSVLGNVFKAISSRPNFLFNPGVASISLRSAWKSLT